VISIEHTPPIVVLLFVWDDGGRAEAGYRGKTGDCAVRAVSIATGVPYKKLYQEFKKDNPNNVKGISWYGHGTPYPFVHTFLARRGFRWHEGGRLDASLPKGTVIANLGRHVCAVIDGVIHDTFCPPAGSKLIGYWIKNV